MAEERATTATVEAPKGGKSNMILIVIIAVLTTLLLGGGAAAFFAFGKGGDQAAEGEAVAAADKADAGKPSGKKKAAKDKDKKEVPKGPAIYIPLEPPFVVNFDAAQSSRFLQVTVQIMTRDAPTAQLVKDNDPMVRNDLLLLFGNQDASKLGTREGKEELRKQALDTVKTLVKSEGGTPALIESVFFTTFVMQ
jgi:flagellar FliL protein